MKDVYPEERLGREAPAEDRGQPLATRWLQHPLDGTWTVTVLSDRAYLLIEPGEPP